MRASRFIMLARGELASMDDLSDLDLDAVLGLEEAALLGSIRAFPGDVDTLHVMTGIPVACIEVKLAALVHLGYARKRGDVYEAIRKGKGES